MKKKKMAPPEATTRLLTSAEVAELLQVSEGSLANWRCASTGPRYVKVGRLVRYREADLAAFIEAGRINPEQAA